MALVIRLRQQGAKNAQTYRLVLIDRKTPRDGKYIEKLGWYNPFQEGEKNLFVQSDRVKYWLENGAEITEKAYALIKRFSPEAAQVIIERKLKQQKKKASKKEKKAK